jgi:glutamate/tyrosine decarboxylase-like PLP-dependent enzyme
MTATTTATRDAPADLDAEQFRELGHALVEQIARFLEDLPDQPVTEAVSPGAVRELIGTGGIPAQGCDPADLLSDTANLLFQHSLHNGHPAFLGYITSSAAPLGALADLLAASINTNIAKWDLSPVASEIEAQTIRWLAELVRYPTDCGGLMVSGGNMANILAFMAARNARAGWDVRTEGHHKTAPQLTVYGSQETHTWIEKAAAISGLGTAAVRWIETDSEQRISMDALQAQLSRDRDDGCQPFMLVGTAGNVSTGAIDPLAAMADFAQQEQLWFHVDGAYGALAAMLADAPADLQVLARADSVALDPHKWLYSPIEAACTLVKNRQHLLDAFAFNPPYYNYPEDADPGENYYELGLQNTRGFRALKVWLSLRHAGRQGYEQMIGDDIRLAQQLYTLAKAHTLLEAHTCNLSICTFRFVPEDLAAATTEHRSYLNELNEMLLLELQQSGKAFLSNAIVNDDYLLRACVVNFRTNAAVIAQVPELVVEIGQRLDARMRA